MAAMDIELEKENKYMELQGKLLEKHETVYPVMPLRL